MTASPQDSPLPGAIWDQRKSVGTTGGLLSAKTSDLLRSDDYRKSSTGSRVKWETTSDDKESIHSGGAHERTFSAPQAPTQDLLSLDGMSDDATSVASKNSTTDLQRSLSTGVPFYVQVLLLMLIPVGFTVALSAMQVHDVTSATTYMKDHEDIVRQMFDCTNAMMNERGQMSVYASFPQGSAAQLARIPFMEEKAVIVDRACGLLHELATEAADKDVQETYARRLVDTMRAWHQIRARALLNNVTGYVDVIRFELVEDVTTVLGILARAQLGRYATANYVQLAISRTMSNAVGSLRATGGYMLSNDVVGGVGTPEYGAARDALMLLDGRLHTAENLFRQVMDDQGRQWYVAYVMDTKDAGDAIARLMRYDATYVSTTPTLQYFSLFTTALTQMNDMALRGGGLVENASTWSTQKSQIIVAVVLMLASALLSGAAAVWLVYQEKKSVDMMKHLLDKAQIINGAVRRYVPIRFMKLIGCRTILEMECGTFTDTAVAILFSDIRDFTTITSSMNNETLFMWLSRYLKRMTAVTEEQKGFVDKFIGDAIMSVFTSSDDAVNAGVQMQVLADEMNLEEASLHNRTDIFRIGVGVHYAVVAAGVLGDDKRHTATLISSEVNLASRLEGLTKYFKARILISAAVAGTLRNKDLHMRRLGNVVAKGATQKTEIFEVFQADPLHLRQLKTLTKDVVEQAVSGLERKEISMAVAKERLMSAHTIDDGLELRGLGIQGGSRSIEDACVVCLADMINENGFLEFAEK